MNKQFKDREKYRIIGLMSGTSLDGLDLICAEFFHKNGSWRYKIIKTKTVPFKDKILLGIKEILGESINVEKNDLHMILGEWMGHCVLDFSSSIGLEIDLVSSHGQTIFHNPEQGITIQIGDGKIMANICGLPVVNDFRSQDVEMGGQGAPLVPVGDLHLFNDFKYCLNLGGIANISEKFDGRIKAFDVCICNIGSNYLASEKGKVFDKNGELGSGGSVIPELLSEWNDLAYFSKYAPKSLDASFFEREMLGHIAIHGNNNSENILRTLYEHIAFQISKHISHKKSKILLTGGGAYNKFLVGLMKNKYDLNTYVPGKELVEFKEALIFAFMGILKVRNENNVLAVVTGSDKDHCAGIIHYPD